MTRDLRHPTALDLAGRRVVVVGGGSAAQRRVPELLASRAVVEVVAPWVTPAIEGLVRTGEVRWTARAFEVEDLAEAWFVYALTGEAEVDERVVAAAEGFRVFCVTSGSAEGSAGSMHWGRVGGLTLSVAAADGDRTAARVRDEVVQGVRDGVVGSTGRQRAASVPGVTLVGGGPGDPGLVTVAGRRALLEADVVVADRLAPAALLGELADDVELIDAAKLPRGRSAQQEEINRVIVARALAGKRVARFKGGDNFVFGRGFEEVIACREAGVAVTVIPGLTSPVAVPGIAGIPVTHRHVAHDVTIVSGHLPPGHEASLVDWDAVARMQGTLLLMMAVENAPAIAAELLDRGRPATTPVAFVCDGTMPGERTVLSTLGEVAHDVVSHEVRPPAIIVVGEVVAVAHPARYRSTKTGAGAP